MTTRVPCRVPERRLDMGLRVRPDHERQRAQKFDRGITSQDVIDKLLELFAMRGVPWDGELSDDDLENAGGFYGGCLGAAVRAY